MLEQLPALLGFDVVELAGAQASGEIPIPAAVLNRLLAAQLQQRQVPVAVLVVEPHDANVILVHVRLRSSLVPALTVQASIEEQARLPDSPVIGIRWSLRGLGVLARLASPVLSLFDLLPPGISVDGDRIAVNLDQLLAARGQADALRLLTHLEVESAEGRLIIRFAARIPGGGAADAGGSDDPPDDMSGGRPSGRPSRRT